jgi:hypothetical protein
MVAREHFLARLLELPRIQDPEVRRGIFRQTITALGLQDAAGGPLALAGVDPKALARSVQMAWSDGLLDDLDFIAPAAAAVALYQIAGALPLGAERRAIGRKVLTYLYKGNAETFAALAQRMALGSTRPLSGAGIHARVSLAVRLHSSSDAVIDRLALAIVTRRELAIRWVVTGATGSLPDRRLAARLLERAAREAARRASAGDDHLLRTFRALAHPGRHLDAGGDLEPAWDSLLADRETLVWRHIAIARGIVSGEIEEFVAETRAALAPELTPTEWRRAATSLTARIAVDREDALAEAMTLLDGPVLRRDPGIAMAMVWGLAPVAEVEPEAADELLEAIARRSPITIADALAELRQDVSGIGQRAAEICAAALQQSLNRPETDDGLASLARVVVADLTGQHRDSRRIGDAVRAALDAFAEHGTPEAFHLARQALVIASELVGELEALDVVYHGGAGTSEPRRRAMELLRDLDGNLLESRTLADLLLLDRAPGSDALGVEAIDDLDARTARWLLDAKRRIATPEELAAQSTLHQRQLRALLHLSDGCSTDFGDDHERRMRVRARWTLAIRTWMKYLREHPPSRLNRAIIATMARAFDALVRDSAAEPVDVLLYAAAFFPDLEPTSIVAEASMHPDVVQLLAGYCEYVSAAPSTPSAEHTRARLDAFKRFLDGFPSQRTVRSEAFRTTAWTLVHALESVIMATSLSQLVPHESGAGPLSSIEDAIGQLGQLVVGAERRCSDEVLHQHPVISRRYALANAVENAVHTGSQVDLLGALASTTRVAEATLPPPIAQLISDALPRLSSLRIERGGPSGHPRAAQLALPDWVPARRIIGGFYVLKQLGGGNVGTVFVVKRAEERHDPAGERLALKVPEYNATAARTMGEKEFLKLFREEAGALLSIPEHRNIARFVTFDAGARPKPILVMELIDGLSCERSIASQSLSIEQAVAVLDGVMGGLEAMHGAGIAHLDVKPSNVILRDSSGEPVLVDFGLAGRHIRPGCATLCYGAPEIWETAAGHPVNSHAAAADVYALGCFAFELMTTLTLFDGSSDVAIIGAHITHDGLPAPVNRMAQTPGLQGFAMYLYQCLRHQPHYRATVTQLRHEFRKVAPELLRRAWPLRLE